MAVQPKKKKTSSKTKSTIKKKPVRKKAPQRKKRKSRKKSSLKRKLFVFFILLSMLSLVAYGYYLGKKSERNHLYLSDVFEGESSDATKQLLEDLSKIKREAVEKKHLQQKIKKRDKPNVVKVAKKVTPAVHQTQKNNIKKQPIKKIALVRHTKKPKLVIIIDDVSKYSQLHAIQSLGKKLTPSIFPPSELSMTSNQLAEGLKHYMIHLPMESGSRQFNTQYKTLMHTFSTTHIEERVRELRSLFPQAHYINNHTGSVFTGNMVAMRRLYKALREEGFVFVDSRTTATSKVHTISDSYGDVYMARDIFIDNIHTVPYIHKQLKKAVTIAKRRGYAIAIGHPHHITMQALASANEILKDVELLYIDELYKER